MPSFFCLPIRQISRLLPSAVALTLCLAASSLQAASYYVDPATGSMSNPGTSASPWSTLEAVFTANKTFVAGDIIYLRTGYHGVPQIKGANTDFVTIQPDTAALPKVARLSFNGNSKYWSVSGLDICPENAGAGLYSTTTLVNVPGGTSYITIADCDIRSANSIEGWTQQNWYDRGAQGLLTYASHTIFTRNKLTNTTFSVQVVKSADHTVISHNTIENFADDAMRGLSDFSTYEYNTILNSFVADANHDDCFQAWSLDASNVVGKGVVYNVTNPQQPAHGAYGCQPAAVRGAAGHQHLRRVRRELAH